MSDVRLVATNPDDNTLVPVASNASGQLAVQSPKIEKVPNDFDVEGDLTVTGSSIISGGVTSGGVPYLGQSGSQMQPAGVISACRPTGLNIWSGYEEGSPSETSEITADGSASFAGGNAGFTAEGYLWCKTKRGNTVILEDTPNSVGMWSDYTPPTRAQKAKERIDLLKEEVKEERDGSSIS